MHKRFILVAYRSYFFIKSYWKVCDYAKKIILFIQAVPNLEMVRDTRSGKIGKICFIYKPF